MALTAFSKRSAASLPSIYFLSIVFLFQSAPTVNHGVKQNDSAKKTTQCPEHPNAIPQDRAGVNYTIETNPQSKSESTNSYDAQKDSLYRCYLGATIVGVLINILVLIFLVKSANAAKKSAEIAEKSLHLLQRADVLIDQAGFVSGLPYPNLHSELKIIFKNFGNTRAENLRIRIELKAEGQEIIQQEVPPLVLGAHDTCTMSFNQLRIIFQPDVVEKILRGEIPLRFEGEFSYQDIFGNPHVVPCAARFYRTTWIIEKA